MTTPASIVEAKVSQLSAKYNIAPETIRGVISEFIESLHEASFKGSPTDALVGVYFTLDAESAWRFWGIIYRSLSEGTKSDPIGDHRAMWYETALRLDSRMKRFSCVLERWSEEHAYDSKQEELDSQDRTEPQP